MLVQKAKAVEDIIDLGIRRLVRCGTERLKLCLEAVIDIFGPERLVFGSDWPVVNLVLTMTAGLAQSQTR
jgi:predicted TIM-barrel fold metal-dependent hydrolase